MVGGIILIKRFGGVSFFVLIEQVLLLRCFSSSLCVGWGSMFSTHGGLCVRLLFWFGVFFFFVLGVGAGIAFGGIHGFYVLRFSYWCGSMLTSLFRRMYRQL